MAEHGCLVPKHGWLDTEELLEYLCDVVAVDEMLKIQMAFEARR